MTKLRAHLIVAFLAITASGNYIPSRLCLSVMSPESLVALRFGIGAIITSLLFPRLTLRLPLKSFCAGAFTGCLFGAALIPLYLSLRSTHSGVTAFLVGLCAVFAPLFEYISMKRVPTRFQVFGLLISLAGSGFMTIHGDLSFDVGSLWALLSACVFGLWSVAISYFRRTVPSMELGLGQIYGTAALFLFIALTSSGVPVSAVTGQMWLALLYLGAVSVSLRFLLQTYAQGFTTATSVEIIFLLEPLFAFLWASAFANEVATSAQLLGCALILIGVLVAQKN